MTLKIKTPRLLAEPLRAAFIHPKTLVIPAEELAARDTQWLELVGPVVDALKQSLDDAMYPSDLISDIYEKAQSALRAITEE